MRRAFPLLFFCICLLSISSFGQIGNEWIVAGQKYVKIKTAREGIYILDRSDLSTAGFDVNQLDPRNLQLFRNGKEEYLHISGQGDGSFDNNDKIYFHGYSNDGKLDEPLYRSPSEQPHQYASLYTDSTVFFLTLSSGNTGKRYRIQTDQDLTGLSPEAYFTHEAVVWFGDQWFDGAPFSQRGSFSEHTEGEGWMSNDVRGGGLSVNIPTPGYYNASSDPIRLEALAFGKSDPVQPGDIDAQGNNHELTVAYGDKSNIIYKSRGRGYYTNSVQTNIPASDYQDLSRIWFISSFGAQQRQAVSYVRVRYPRSYDNISESVFRLKPKGNSRYVRLTNYSGSSSLPFVWDLGNKELIPAQRTANEVFMKVSNTPSTDLLISDSTAGMIELNGGDLEPMDLTPFELSSTADYLIISHSSLAAGCTEYAKYRESAVGGNYEVDVIYVDQLYDQFYYGYHHPLAIKNFIRALWQNGGKQLRYVNIIGKGQSYYLCTFDHARRRGLDLVPAYGFPASDHLYATGLDHGDAVPSIPIGRLPAKTNQEILRYLDKVKLHEVTLNDPVEWKKHAIHISGGTSKSENEQFRGYLGSFEERLKGDSLGGFTTLFSKDQNVIIQDNLTTAIIGAVNDGSSMLTYFGHGSSDVLEVDIGQVNQYRNEGRLPLFYFNGCILGNTYDISSLGEQFLLEPEVGAINWLASTNYGFTTILHDYGKLFHEKMFLDNYGAGIGEVIRNTIVNYMDEDNPLKRTMCHQFVCHGDPAIKYFSPSRPDLTFDQGNTGLDPVSLQTGGDSVYVEIGLKNLGKTGAESIWLEMIRTNSSGFSKTYRREVPAPNYKGIYRFRVERTDTFRGLNRVTLRLDPQNEIKEQSPSGEMNNSLITSFYIPFENIYLHSPRNNDIVSSTNATLSVRSGSSTPSSITVDMEFDTTRLFNSPVYHHRRGTGISQVDISTIVPGLDSTDFYWRARLSGAKNWTQGNFAMILGSDPGVSQQNADLMERGSLERMWIDSAGRYHFSTTTSQQYHIQTSGKNGNFRRGIRINGYLSRMFWFVIPGVQLVAINPRDESRYMISSRFHTTSPRTPESFGYPELKDDPYYILGNPTGVYQFNTTNKEDRDSLTEFLRNIPDDYFVFMHNGTETGIEEWEAALLTQFERFGWTNMKARLDNDEPMALLGRKLAPENRSIVTADTSNQVITPDRQDISLTTNLSIPHAAASLTTESIGPARSWEDAGFVIRENTSDASDKNTLQVIAFDSANKEFVLRSADSNFLDLSDIDASAYPYLRLRIHFRDSVKRTINQLKRWICHFQPAPDGSIVNSSTRLLKDTTHQGEQVIVYSSFKNLGIDTFASTTVLVEVHDANRSLLDSRLDTIQPLAPGQVIDRIDTFNLDLYHGKAEVLVDYNTEANPPEPEFLNNSRILPLYITRYRKNARADLRIDGRIVMDKEIVRPDPEISVLVSQSDSFVFYDDLTLFNMYMKHPGEDSFRTVDLFSPNVEFAPTDKAGSSTRLTLNSEPLDDGEYTVRVLIRNPVDPGQEDQVEARFEVINKQSVSNVYFYPNPFTTNARIVYTLTGATPPDQFRIDIYTISGRRVKSIDLHEMENLSIGTHLSEYQWDATDEFGDRLANGVYLYKVHVRSDGQNLEHFERPGDDLFTKGFGKLYIMR